MVHPERKSTKVNRGSRQRQEYLIKTAATQWQPLCPPVTHQRSSAQAKEGKVFEEAFLFWHGKHCKTKASKPVVLKLCSVEPWRTLGNPAEVPHKGCKEKGQDPGIHTRSVQRLFVYFTHRAFL